MSRLYFDCPIKALYMMREFGVKLRNFTTRCLLEALNNNDDLGKIYINPESESIFEPKEGDRITRDGLIGFVSKLYSSTGESASLVITEGTASHPKVSQYLLKHYSDIKIIMRDGKHFFQPLKED